MLALIQLQAQKSDGRQLIWSIGEVEMTRGQEVEVRYPIRVAISDASENPELGSSTFRFFYDAGQLSGLNIESIANDYQVKGLNQSNDVFGDVFNFVGGGGIFAQFNIMANLENLVGLSTEPVHVMDLKFTVVPGTKIPLCAPLVLDNQSEQRKNGQITDTGYLMNEGGISGTYHLNHNKNALHLADDEVEHYLWERSAVFGEKVNRLSDRPGHPIRLKSNTCLQLRKPTLSVDLDLFDVWKASKDQIRLNWKTLSEFNNGFFDIQQSGDGVVFETIGSVEGQWNALKSTEYEFLDLHPLAGRNYYRLMMVDNDGSTVYSQVRTVDFEETPAAAVTEDWNISYFPNPSRGSVYLSSNIMLTNVDLEVYNTAGQLVIRKDNVSSESTLDLSGLNAGIYSLTLIDREGKQMDTRKITIVKQ
ncbi:MAG: T9SS type A sorting domain-containing protein [Saprospiraceae bacterium]|nr:T9SS type A sorting domain-containing protein [Lewinella sp.]